MHAGRWLVLFLALALTASACAEDEQAGPAGGAGGSDADSGMDAGLDASPGGSGGSGGAGGQGGDDDAGAVADDSGTEPPSDAVADPAPQFNDPGAYTCSGCPTSDRSLFEDDAGALAARRYTGRVTGAVGDGIYYLASAGGEAISGTVPTDESSGQYAVTVPLFCGEQTLKLLWSNTRGTYVEVIAVRTEECSDVEIRVAVSWDAVGYDWELHLVKEGGKINDNASDCTWTSCVSTSPDWGVAGDDGDNPHKDVDDMDDYGPENIWLASPEEGTYTVMVEHLGSGSPDSDGRVIFNVSGRMLVVEIENLAPQHVWTAGTIRWPEAVITTSREIFDCSASWSGGCQADIP